MLLALGASGSASPTKSTADGELLDARAAASIAVDSTCWHNPESYVAMDMHIDAIKDSYELLPSQLKAAARWLLDHPTEVALLSMREQAHCAGLPPATFTRLAKRLGFDGFESLKAAFADVIRECPKSLARRAEGSPSRRGDGNEAAVVCRTINALCSHLRCLAKPSMVPGLVAAADLMMQAQYIFCLGFRSSFAVASLVHDACLLLGSRTVLIDGIGGRAGDDLAFAGPRDVLVSVTMSPYTRYTVQLSEFAVSRGTKLIALTDSELSPVARLSDVLICVQAETASCYHTVTPAFAAAESLIQLIAAKCGRGAHEDGRHEKQSSRQQKPRYVR